VTVTLRVASVTPVRVCHIIINCYRSPLIPTVKIFVSAWTTKLLLPPGSFNQVSAPSQRSYLDEELDYCTEVYIGVKISNDVKFYLNM